MSAQTFAQKNHKVGDEIPNFKLWFTDGTRLTQNDTKGKVILFKFWFTSCMPCIVDIPTLNEFVDELKDRDDILFIAPALDRSDIVKKFISENEFKFKIAYSAMDVSKKFNPRGHYPTYIVVDKNGKFAYVDSNGKQSHFMPLKRAVLNALNE